MQNTTTQSNFTSISLRFHVDSTSIERRYHFDFASSLRRVHFNPSILHRFHFDFTCIPRWLSLSSRNHCRNIDLASVSLQFGFSFSSILLRPPSNRRKSAVETKSVGQSAPGVSGTISLRFQCGSDSVSLRFYFDLTSISLRFHFD